MSEASKPGNSRYPADMTPPRALSWITSGLAMGRRPQTYIGFDLAVSCEEHLARKPMVGYYGLTLHVPMRDEEDFEMPVDVIGRAAFLIDHTVRFGGKVIVHCTGGLNRSGVVVAEALKTGAGMDGKDAVALIRRQHDEFALCNRVFERWVTGEQLPTAETSTFRLDAA
jgi:hypothetical protein